MKIKVCKSEKFGKQQYDNATHNIHYTSYALPGQNSEAAYPASSRRILKGTYQWWPPVWWWGAYSLSGVHLATFFPEFSGILMEFHGAVNHAPISRTGPGSTHHLPSIHTYKVLCTRKTQTPIRISEVLFTIIRNEVKPYRSYAPMSETFTQRKTKSTQLTISRSRIWLNGREMIMLASTRHTFVVLKFTHCQLNQDISVAGFLMQNRTVK